ncbi:MAG: hypothetical protein NVSMB23_15040 [Myxococcales bacterium]
MAIDERSTVERQASAFRRCFLAGAVVLLGAVGGEALSSGAAVKEACPLERTASAEPCPQAPMAAAHRLAQLRPEQLLLEVGGVLGRAIVSELRGD